MSEQSEPVIQTADELLESSKGKYANCLVIGFNPDDDLIMASSVSNIPYMHWVLNRALFELNLFEKQSGVSHEETPGSEVDAEASDK